MENEIFIQTGRICAITALKMWGKGCILSFNGLHGSPVGAESVQSIFERLPFPLGCRPDKTILVDGLTLLFQLSRPPQNDAAIHFVDGHWVERSPVCIRPWG
jgi:hypothetical protein